MRTQAQVGDLLRRLYQDLGKDPAELIQIRPVDGGWHNALSYEVTRGDKKQTRIYRCDLDDNNDEKIKVRVTTIFDGCSVAHSDGALMRAA